MSDDRQRFVGMIVTGAIGLHMSGVAAHVQKEPRIADIAASFRPGENPK